MVVFFYLDAPLAVLIDNHLIQQSVSCAFQRLQKRILGQIDSSGKIVAGDVERFQIISKNTRYIA